MLKAVQTITEAVSAVTGGALHSAWLYGSAVLDDFRPGWSDVDLLILTSSPLSEEQAKRLLMLRQELAEKEPGNPYYRACEGIIACVREYRFGAFRRLVYWGTTGQRITDRCVPDTFARAELARVGRCIAGTEDRSLFAEPDRAELRAAVQAHCDAIRRFAGQTDESLYSCGWLLDIARGIHTLRTGDVIAKTQAGLWALEEHLFPDEGPLRRTLEIRQAPLRYKDRPEVREWLKGLGPAVQRYTDVLERELREAERREKPGTEPAHAGRT